MSKDEWMEAWQRLAKKDQLAARLALVVVAILGETQEREVRQRLLSLGMECSKDRLEDAYRAMAAAGLGTIGWLQ